MEPIKAPKTLKVYSLVKQSGMTFHYTGSSSSMPSLGLGFYPSLQEAEHNRTLEALKDTTSTGTRPSWHIWELEVPNPAYQE